MSVAWQQQVFALDARYNAHRAKGSPNFRTLYIRRRNQLLREFGSGKDSNLCRQYLKIRGSLLQSRYGSSFDQISLRRLSTRTSPESNQCNDWMGSFTKDIEDSTSHYSIDDLSPSNPRHTTIHENYAFVGVHHIFDQHTAAVTMLKFANNDRARLCCISNDSTLSICNLLSQPPTLECILKGHTAPVTGCDWSMSNDLLVSSSLDGQLCVWDTSSHKCIRAIRGTTRLLSCLFHPVNNNVVIAGNINGHVEVVNISTGIKHSSSMGGRVLSMAFESSGVNLWAGNDQGYLMLFRYDMNSGKLTKFRRIFLGEQVPISSINWRAWISRETRDPSLLVNLASNSLRLYRVTDKGLELKKNFKVKHSPFFNIKSTFCPIMSFRKGACIVTGSEDSCVYFLDVESDSDSKAVVNKLQGHSSPVLSVSFNYDESLLSTSDNQGLVIVWTRTNKQSSDLT
ncbi:hypothetical protein GE061_012871 [Apolygus lucorum]|uniref:WD repeat-containing protein 55 homolog n=1 Tax=Apolygus lucorum TaxID=248454 RepID=A0A6A4K347_APOLU|nr:hypothetical protein GE061_012871 [Apolygus lucorum]